MSFDFIADKAILIIIIVTHKVSNSIRIDFLKLAILETLKLYSFYRK